jgi:HEAT repeat protein
MVARTLILSVIMLLSLFNDQSGRQVQSAELAELVSELYARGLDNEAVLVADYEIKARLVRFAKSSERNRSEVIKALTDMLDDPAINNALGSADVWHTASEVLAELKAIEALDVLIRHLNYTDIVRSYSLWSMPTLRAVVSMGKAAVPKLATALAEGPTLIRARAISAIGLIGGREGRDALESALRTETDPIIQNQILAELEHNCDGRC